MACEDYPTASTAKTFKLDAETTNEVVTLQQDRTSPASDGKTKKTFWGIENDATLQRENIDQLAEQQRENLESTFTAQFAYKRIGNISLYVGDSLPEADKLNSYQYPDDSGEWYGPVQDRSFPITIPADPSSDNGWALVNALTTSSLGNNTQYQSSSVSDMINGITLSGVVSINLNQTWCVDDYYGGASPNNSGVLFFKVVTGGTGIHDGGKYIDSPSGFQFVQIMKLPVSILAYGARGDWGVTDNTVNIQNALYYVGGGIPSTTEVFPPMRASQLYIPSSGAYKITDQVHHPAWVSVVGESSGALNSSGLDAKTAVGSIIYADFADTDKTAWLASGFTVNSSPNLPPVGDLIDVYKNAITSVDYDDGNLTRSYGSSISGVIFHTDKYVACAVGFGAAQGARCDIQTNGFLSSCISSSSWGASLKAQGVSYHVGIFNYNSNGAEYYGYVNLKSGGTPPALDENTAPSGWVSEDSINNPPELRFLTTGLYSNFVNSAVINALTTEGWGRSRFFSNCEGNTDLSPYVEGITELPYHIIGSRVSVSDPQYNSVLNGLARISAFGALDINNMKAGILVDYGSQTSFGASARLSVTYARQSYVAAGETFSPAVDMHFMHEDVIKVYVSADGSDAHCGLNEDNAVRSFSVAVDRAIYYNADVIYISDGETVYYGGDPKTLNRDIRVESVTPGSSAAIRVEAGTDGFSNHLILDSIKLTFKNINLILNGTHSGSQSTRGWINPRGACGIVLDSSNVSVSNDPSNLSLFILSSNTSATMTLSGMDGSYNGSNWAFDEFGNDSFGKVITSFTGFTTSAIWPSTWTEL